MAPAVFGDVGAVIGVVQGKVVELETGEEGEDGRENWRDGVRFRKRER